MNGQYYKNPRFPTLDEEETVVTEEKKLDLKLDDCSYRDILLNNKGKKIKIYSCLKDSSVVSYEGTLEQVGADFLIINNKQNVQLFMLLLDKIDYIEFIDNIEYKNILDTN